MNKIKLLHTSDLHIGSPLSAMGNHAKIRQAELLDTFGKITETAKYEKADILIISGDLFDSSVPKQSDLNFVQRKLAEIPEVKVFIALGNHDAGLKAQFPSNVHIFGNSIEKIEYKDFDIYGVSFESEYVTGSILEGFVADNLNKINILAVHGDIVGNGQTSQYNPTTVGTIAQSGAEYAAFGHIHQFSGILTANKTKYAYCGIPEGRGFDELGGKGVIIGDICKDYADLKFKEICKRKYIEINADVSNCCDYSEILSEIEKSAIGESNIYKVNLIGKTDNYLFIDTNFIKDRLMERYFYVKVHDFTSPKINIDSLSKEYTLKGLFVKNLIEKGGSDSLLKIGLSAINGERVYFE